MSARDVDLAPERRGQAEHDAAFDLRLHDLRVDHLPAIDDAADLVDLECALVDRDLRDLGNVGRIAFHQREPEMMPRRHSSPARELRSCLQDASMARLLLQQLQTKRERVLSRGMGELVHEALDREAVDRMADRAHVADADADFLARVVDAEIRHVIGVVRGALDDGIEGIGGVGCEPRRDRGADAVKAPRDEFLAGIETGVESDRCRRSVVVVRHVVFTRPNQLDGGTDGFRRGDRRGYEIDLEAAAETATEQRRVHAHALRRQSGGLRRRRLGHLLHLGSDIKIAALGGHVGRAVHRFHRRVGEQRQFIGGRVQRGRGMQGRGNVAFGARGFAGIGCWSLVQQGADRGIVERRGLA